MREMPNRIIREGMLTSRRVDKIFGITELFYRRLQQIVDDYGRFEADPTLIRAKVFPKRINDIKEKQIVEWLTKCVQADLLQIYKVKGIMFLEVKDFRQHIRAKKSIYPSPDERDAEQENCRCSADEVQMQRLDVDVDVDVCVDVEKQHTTQKALVSVSFDEFWKAYPRKVGKGKARESWKRLKPTPEMLSRMLSTLRWQTVSDRWQRESGRFIPNPATWLNQERWLDEPSGLKHSSTTTVKGSDGKDYDVPEVSL